LILIFIAATRKNITLVMAILFVLSSLYSYFMIVDIVAIGPKGETRAYVYLKVSYRLGYEWVKSEWDFYRPDCYVESCSLKYIGHSLRISAFDYDYGGNPFHSLPRYIFNRLLCGYSDSETAFKKYREKLLEKGFSINDGLNSFKAENETLKVYCKLDSNFIVIAVVDSEEEYLLDQLILRNIFDMSADGVGKGWHTPVSQIALLKIRVR